MNQDDTDEQAFQDYLKGDSTLSSQYRKAATEQPPSVLDNAILTAAHREVESKPRIKSKPLFSNWRIPLSMAAVVTFCVGLAISLHNESGFFSSAPDFGVAQNEAPNSASMGEFDRLADEVLPLPSERFVAEETEEQRRSSSKPSPLDSQVKDNLVAMNEAKITSRTEGLIERKNFKKAVPTRKHQPKIIAPASPVIAKKSKKLGAQFSGKIAQETVVASAKPHPTTAARLSQPKPITHAQALQNQDRRTATLNAGLKIEEIQKLWRNGEKAKAEKQLKIFLKQKPNYDVAKLRRKLDSKFVDRVIKALKE